MKMKNNGSGVGEEGREREKCENVKWDVNGVRDWMDEGWRRD
jgi:hypothetical protein